MTRIVTQGQDNWNPRRPASQWQTERARGPILPMHPASPSLLGRVRGWIGR